ncbi:MAG: universal stress protein [Deltaproteobacteria bacterium]|nr:universal stress protein [Deltaproteobacteria bacterium]
MAAEKLLHITDKPALTPMETHYLEGLRPLGLREVIVFHPARSTVQPTTSGLVTKVVTEDGPLVPELLNAARRESVSLISTSMNRPGSRWFQRAFARELLRASFLPVVLLPASGALASMGQGGVFDHVIFAADWSDGCQRAMGFLLATGGIIQALEIVHVVEKKLSVRDMRQLKRRLSEARDRFLKGGIDAESHVYAGKRHEEILQAADDYHGSCIVTGRGTGKALFGLRLTDCAYRVAETARVPVIAVP